MAIPVVVVLHGTQSRYIIAATCLPAARQQVGDNKAGTVHNYSHTGSLHPDGVLMLLKCANNCNKQAQCNNMYVREPTQYGDVLPHREGYYQCK